MRIFRGLGSRIGLTMFAVGLALSPAVWDSAKLLQMAGEGAIAEYRLRQLPPERYNEEIAIALAARDGDIARSLIALATDQGVSVDPQLLADYSALPPVDVGHVLGQGWECIVNGDFESEAGFACVVATDLTSVGDVRDLVQQGGNYVTGQPVNYFTLGIATVGLTLTAATVTTGGAMLPLRAGASFLKAANKVGKMPPRLVAEVSGLLARSINRGAMDEALVAARELRLGDIGAPLGRLFNPRAMARVTDLADDFGRIGKVGGVRAMKLSAEAAESTRDVKLLARTAERWQDKFPAVMKMLGRGAIRLADLLWTIGSWFVAAALWMLSMAWFMLRTTTKVARFGGRMMFRRRAV